MTPLLGVASHAVDRDAPRARGPRRPAAPVADASGHAARDRRVRDRRPALDRSAPCLARPAELALGLVVIAAVLWITDAVPLFVTSVLALETELIEDTAGQYAIERIVPATIGGTPAIVTVGSNYVRVFQRAGKAWSRLTIAGLAREVAIGDLDGVPGDWFPAV